LYGHIIPSFGICFGLNSCIDEWWGSGPAQSLEFGHCIVYKYVVPKPVT